jgi:hypothetical protein
MRSFAPLVVVGRGQAGAPSWPGMRQLRRLGLYGGIGERRHDRWLLRDGYPTEWEVEHEPDSCTQY